MTQTVTFEAGDTSGYALGGANDFGGATSSLSTTAPAGASGNAAQVIKGAGAETWAGTTFLPLSGQELITTSSHTVTMKVWSPDAGIEVRLKFEDAGNPTHSIEISATTTVAGGWQTLTFDVLNESAGTAEFVDVYTFNRASVFFDFGNTGTGKTYYFDDIVNGATPTPTPTPTPTLPLVTFDAGDTSGYVLGGSNDFGGAASSRSTTPPAGASGNAGQVIKGTGAKTWAGTTFLAQSRQELVTSANHVVTMNVWSPDAGIEVRLKFEDATDPTHSVETSATTTVAGGWQTLTFDVLNESAGTAEFNDAYTFNRASVFFDFGHAGTGKTYYFDDIVNNATPTPTPTPTPTLPLVTFDAGDSSGYILGGGNDFGGATSSLSNTDGAGSNHWVTCCVQCAWPGPGNVPVMQSSRPRSVVWRHAARQGA